MKPSRALVLFSLAALAATVGSCTCSSPSQPHDLQSALDTCDDRGGFACTWAKLCQSRGAPDSLGSVLTGEPRDLDAVLRSMFPAIGDKPIVDGELPVPQGVIFKRRMFPPHPLSVPIDWDADPQRNNTWRLYFQSLSWLHGYAVGDSPDVDTGAAILTDWVDDVLYRDPPLPQTWEGHAMSMRFERAAALVHAYIAHRPVLNRRFLHAAAQLLLTHIYAMAADLYYRPRHNHSTMVDLALLSQLRRYPALRDAEELRAHAKRRLLEQQVAPSVTADGIHVENTPAYHLFYLQLLHQAIQIHRDAGEPVPPTLVRARDSMLEPLVRMLQPDLTFPQFGDGDNAVASKALGQLLEQARKLDVGDRTLLAPLEWAVTRGASGEPPRGMHRVYEQAGYGFFRTGWRFGPDSPDTTVHFKTSRLSRVHYHADETGFEIFAHGRALLTGPGYFTYDESDPFMAYQRSPAAHNVLVVDGYAGIASGASNRSRVVDHGGESGVTWIQGTHDNYRDLGVGSLVRTLAYVQPDTVVVVDHVGARGQHSYDQHFHLHPDLAEVRVHDDRTVVASVTGGPSITLAAAAAPMAMTTYRGERVGAERRGWYFPAFQVAVPAYDVVLRHERDDTDLDLVVVMAISAPGQPARIPAAVTYAEVDGQATVTWRMDGRDQRVRFPSR